MEIIRFRSYNEEERRIITNEYLVPKLSKSYGTEEMAIRFEPEALESLVKKVKNVRQIEKIVGKCLRKGMTAIHVYKAEEYVVTEQDIDATRKNYAEPNERPRVGF